MFIHSLAVAATVSITCVRRAYVQSTTSIDLVHEYGFPCPILLAQIVRALEYAEKVDPKILAPKRSSDIKCIAVGWLQRIYGQAICQHARCVLSQHQPWRFDTPTVAESEIRALHLLLGRHNQLYVLARYLKQSRRIPARLFHRRTVRVMSRALSQPRGSEAQGLV